MFDQLKPLLRSGERYIIVENGKPQFVMMRFEDYAILTTVQRVTNPEVGNRGRWGEEVDAELAEVRDVALESPVSQNQAASDPNLIRLEDLPL